MADFPTWSQPNLAKLAADQQAEIVRINNEQARTLVALKGLAQAFEYECDIYCKKPTRNPAYVAAIGLLK